jgi:hypothetical protein
VSTEPEGHSASPKNWRVLAIICVVALYAVALFLPVRLAEAIWGGEEPTGAIAFLRVLQTIFDGHGFRWHAMGAMISNFMFMFGLACLWLRRPLVAVGLGLVAALNAVGWILWAISLVTAASDPDIAAKDCGVMQNLGAWTWVISMLVMCAFGFWLNQTQIREQREATH